MSGGARAAEAARSEAPTGPRLAIWDGPAGLEAGDAAWERLAWAVRHAAPDLLLLNEMPFGPWISAAAEPDPGALAASRRAHERGLAALETLGVSAVLGTRPALDERGRGVNEAFVWSREDGLVTGHTKQFFPEEPGYWEARWFRRGALRFRPVPVPAADRTLRVGFLICTDLWFNEWARRYGRQGVGLIVVPRATPPETVDRWRTAVRMAALVSGCWTASANRTGVEPGTGQRFGGAGWIFDPDGTLVAETSATGPVAVATLDLAAGARAQLEYPRYVTEPEEPPPAG